MKNYFQIILLALLNQTWRIDAFFYFKGKGMNNKFAEEKSFSITLKEWREINQSFV